MRISNKGKPRGNPGGAPVIVRLFRFIVKPWVWQLLALVAVALLIYWQWPNIKSWSDSVVRLFGWGLLFIVIILGTLDWAIWKHKLSIFHQPWNRWLGGIVLLLVLWGILAFIPGKRTLAGVSLGGKIGQGIIGYTDWVGAWRLVGLFVIGAILTAPGACLHSITGSARWLAQQFKQPGRTTLQQQPSEPERPVRQQKPSVTASTPTRPAPRPPAAEPEKEKTPAATAAAPTPQELKQVAQEVWKKYGESPSLVVVDGWKLPPIDILDITPEIQFSQADNAERARLIEEALASYGVETSVVQINTGPTVTQFGVEPGWDRRFKELREKDKDGNIVVKQEEVSKTRVKVDRITSLSNDLALALAAPTIRIEAPVPGKSIVGIEVPNTISSMVSLRGVIETNVFQKLHSKTKIAVALGMGAGGEAVSGDLAKMPHLLIAGATGSGKTVCLNAVICCLLLNNTPADVRFIMIDPKRVELTTFNSIPHLAAPVIVDADKAVQALRGLSQEMNERYKMLASAGSRNIEVYNKNKQGDEKMPYLVLIIDELADLMVAGGDEVEQTLCRLAQLSRAVGIHLVVATQRPSVDVVTGLIKANFPTRISFAVTSQVDSRTILDIGGAEKLLGSGDMLYMPTEASKPKRLQGCYVSDAEAERLVYFWGSQHREEPTPRLKIEEIISSPVTTRAGGYPEDSLMTAARELAREHTHISTSFLQRRLHIGYPRAARIMEQLEEEMEMDEMEQEEPGGGED
ncbi:DNA translocase FtsK [Chloroflexota bacterium]